MTQSNKLVPFAMATVTLLFVGLVAYQVMRSGEETVVSGEEPKTTILKQDPSDPKHPTVETSNPPDTKNRFQTLIDESGIARNSQEEEAVRRQILEYFDLILITPDRKENAFHYHEVRQELEEYLASLDPLMVPLLMEMLEAEKYFINRYILIRALGEIGSDLAADALVARFDYALEHLKQKEVERTIQSLGRVDTDHSFEVLNGLLERDDLGAMANRFRFVKELGNHSQNAQATRTFLDLNHESGDPRVRDAAARGLKQAARWDTATEIEEVVKKEESPYVKQSLMGALGAIGDQNSLAALREVALTDEDDSNRASAAQAIFRIGGPNAKKILLKIAEEDKDEAIRARARSQVRKLDERND